jgi:ribosomal-protein-alanine N-acetyltransferase
MLELNFSPFPVLKTQRLVLRKVELSDANEIFFLRSDAEVLKYLSRSPIKTIEEVQRWIELIRELEKNSDGITWAISLNGDNKLIGTICYWNISKEHHRAEIGYALHPMYQGNGIMQESMMAILHYGFNHLGFHSVEAKVDPENTPSIELLARNGFVREGYYKEDYLFESKFLDTAVYSLLISSFYDVPLRGQENQRLL